MREHDRELQVGRTLQRRFVEVEHLEVGLRGAGHATEGRGGKGLKQSSFDQHGRFHCVMSEDWIVAPWFSPPMNSTEYAPVGALKV